MAGHPVDARTRSNLNLTASQGLFASTGVDGTALDRTRKSRQVRQKKNEKQDTRMNMKSYKTWALLGAAGGAGFGLVAVPLFYILINLSPDGVAFGPTARFAVANGVTWGILGLFAGIFFWIVNTMRNPPEEN